MIGELVMVTGRTVLLVRLTAVLLAPVPASAQSEEVNKALARRFYEEVWFSRNPAAVDELVAAEYVVHDMLRAIWWPRVGNGITGPDARS